MLEVPTHGFFNADLKCRFRIPAQIGFDFRGVDTIALIVAEAVFHEGNHAFIDALHSLFAAQELPIAFVLLHNAAHGLQNRLHDLNILALVMPADVVDAAIGRLVHHQINRLTMILHVQPVADVQALAIDGQRFALQDIIDHEWNEFLRKLIRPVVVRAARDADGHTIRVAISADHQVRTRLRRRIRAVGLERRIFRKESCIAQTAIDLVRRNLVEANAGFPRRVALFVLTGDPIAARTIQQILRTENICLQEELRIFDTAVHVALSCKIYDHIEMIFGKQIVDQLAIAYVSAHEEAALLIDVVGDSAQIARIGEQV